MVEEYIDLSASIKRCTSLIQDIEEVTNKEGSSELSVTPKMSNSNEKLKKLAEDIEDLTASILCELDTFKKDLSIK